MNTAKLITYIDSEDIDSIRVRFKRFKINKPKVFLFHLEKLKLIFINSKDILLLNKIALIFKEFKVHSSVPLIVSKLTSGEYDKEGGTLIYALNGLKRFAFIDDLEELWNRDISYEMEQMLLMIGVE